MIDAKPVKIEGHEAKEVSEIKYLGVRMDHKGSLEPQLRYIHSQIINASIKAEKLANIGSPRYVCQYFLSIAIGNFNHALELQPILSDKWYAKIQHAINKGLKNILRLNHLQIGRQISQRDLLIRAGNVRTAKNSHKYLACSRINEIWTTQRPQGLYNELKKWVRLENNTTPIRPIRNEYEIFRSDPLELSQERNDFEYLTRSGQHIPFLAWPDEITAAEMSNSDYRKSWPACHMTTFNDQPEHVRSLLGSEWFKINSKQYFNSLCQHAVTHKKYCRHCDPKNNPLFDDLDWKLSDLQNYYANDNLDIASSPKSPLQKLISDVIAYCPDFHASYKISGKIPEIFINILNDPNYKPDFDEVASYLK